MADDTLTLDHFQTLLKLQDLDSAADQLNHRRANLPGHAVLTEVQTEAMQLRPLLQEAAAARDELRRQQEKLESDIAACDKRVADINGRLYDSQSKIAPADALAMSQEVRHLNERKSHLEDSELEIMEKLEPAEAAVAPLEQKAQALAQKLQVAQADIANGQAQIDAELAGLQSIRETVVPDVPGSLLAEYEQLRKRLGGIAAAPLTGNSCGGCHLTMAATELAALKSAPPSALLHCEECGRLLVSTGA